MNFKNDYVSKACFIFFLLFYVYNIYIYIYIYLYIYICPMEWLALCHRGVGKWILKLMEWLTLCHSDDWNFTIFVYWCTWKSSLILQFNYHLGKKREGMKRYVPQKNFVAYALESKFSVLLFMCHFILY